MFTERFTAAARIRNSATALNMAVAASTDAVVRFRTVPFISAPAYASEVYVRDGNADGRIVKAADELNLALREADRVGMRASFAFSRRTPEWPDRFLVAVSALVDADGAEY